MTDTVETPKADRTPEQEARRGLHRAVARALARVDGGTDEFKTRWTEDRSKYVGEGKKLVKALAKAGVTLTYEGKAEDEGDSEA